MEASILPSVTDCLEDIVILHTNRSSRNAKFSGDTEAESKLNAVYTHKQMCSNPPHNHTELQKQAGNVTVSIWNGDAAV